MIASGGGKERCQREEGGTRVSNWGKIRVDSNKKRCQESDLGQPWGKGLGIRAGTAREEEKESIYRPSWKIDFRGRR